MNRLLGDLDLTPAPYSFSKKAFFLLAFAALFSASTFAYFQLADQFTNPSTALKNTELSVTSITNNKTTDHPIISATPLLEEKTIPTIDTEAKAQKRINTQPKSSSTAKISTNKATKTSPLETNSSLQKAAGTAPILFIEKSEIQTSPIASQKILPTTKKIISNILEVQTTTPKTELVAKTTIAQRSNKNIKLLPLLDSKLDLLSANDLGDKLKECPTFGNRLWHMSIIPEIGYSKPFKTLQLADEQYLSAFENRVANENSLEGVHASISLKFQNHVTGLYVKPGFSYAQYTEQLNYLNIDIQRDTSIGIISTTTSPAGDTITTIAGEIIMETEITSRAKIHYQLRQFSIPVAVGYTFRFKKFSLDVEGGINFNFLQKTQGQILNPSSEFTDLSNQQDFFKKSVGLGFFGGVFLTKQFSGHSEFYVGPRFTHHIFSFSSNQNPINQKYNVLGLHVGCVYTIF